MLNSFTDVQTYTTATFLATKSFYYAYFCSGSSFSPPVLLNGHELSFVIYRYTEFMLISIYHTDVAVCVQHDTPSC